MKDSNKELTAEQKVEKVIILCIKEAIAGELADEDNASRGAETIMRIIQSECKRFALECVPPIAIGSPDREGRYMMSVANGMREQMIKNIEDKSK